MSAEKKSKIIGVALAVCIVCSILVSTAAVTLNSIQEQNQKLDRIRNILAAGNLLDRGKDIQKIYNEYIEADLIELSTGKVVHPENYTNELNVSDFDIRTMANNPKYSTSIPANEDIAQIKRKPTHMPVYYVREEGELEEIILPVYGKGLWSTMYGFIALNRDLHTVDGFTFYSHGETPGLGGEVDNPQWKEIWKGKKAFDENWNVKIEVIKGRVDPERESAKYQIDGLSGSTLTTRGIDNLIKYWLGENGYGPFFEILRKELSDDQI
ncbi:MAG: Na(+)-translocating NADH-quinone reductase subunit C [Calditrichaeota bacterium]|nr:Na(+)-translocating NADH-quinone reductase subunit C [Calditrichota bacterium]RQW04515.1 MAG: Na(+)-translocating NADH-quinone reductase subunit C [Calditrichota bacterium]